MNLQKRMFKQLQKTANIYEEYGYENRKAYLEGLANEYDVPVNTVFSLAQMLGSNEDFDGLVTAVEDYAERLMFEQDNQLPPMEGYTYKVTDFDFDQLEVIHEYSMGLWTDEQINMIHPAFSPDQLEVLLTAFDNDFSADDVKSFAKPEMSATEMRKQLEEKMDDVKYLRYLELTHEYEDQYKEAHEELIKQYPEFKNLNEEQAYSILYGLNNGLSYDDVKNLTNPSIPSTETIDRVFEMLDKK
jgi:hypothetical protein